MMRAWAIVATTLCGLSQAEAHSLRTDQQSLGNGDVATGPGAVKEAVMPAQVKTIPQISATGGKSQQTSAVVTAEFCRTVLKEVANRQAPYFVDGKFTGECRKNLVEQCGDRMCKWASHYKTLASDCPSCPTDCEKGSQSRKSFETDFQSNLQIVGTQKFYLIMQNGMAPAPAQGSGTLPVGAAPKAGSGSGSGDAPCPAGGCPRTTVTKGFCKQMLADISAGLPPYFLEGRFTGESRTTLIEQCSAQICGWALRVQLAGIPKCGSSPCCMPETCKMPQEYLKDLVQSGQLLDVIRIVGQNSIMSADPSKPPASIPAQQPSPTPMLRGPVAVSPTNFISANDPRDPDFASANKVVAADDDDDDDAKKISSKKATKAKSVETDDLGEDDGSEMIPEPKKISKKALKKTKRKNNEKESAAAR